MDSFEQQLIDVASSVALEVEPKPMIIMGFHNPMIITEYVIEQHSRPSVQNSVPDIVEIDPAFQQKVLELVEVQGRKFHALIWESVLPLLIGFETADTDIQQELDLMFGKSVNVSLDPYRRILKETTYSAVLSHVIQELRLPPEQAVLMLKSKLDEVQAKRQGLNAGSI